MEDHANLAAIAGQAATIASGVTSHLAAAAAAMHAAAAVVEINWKGNAGASMYQALASSEVTLRKLDEQSQSIANGFLMKSTFINADPGAAGGR